MAETADPILLVDDDEAILAVCTDALNRQGYEVVQADCAHDALQRFSERQFSAAIVDLVLPDIDGLSLLSALREADPDVVVVLMTGYASLESAIDAVRRGAYDYLRKPFSSSELARVVARGLSQRRLAVHNRVLLQELDLVNRDLMHKVKAATDELTAFISLGRRLDSKDGPLTVLLDLARAAAQLTAASSVAIFAAADAGLPRSLVAEGDAAAELRALSAGCDDPALRQALQTGNVVIVPELLADPALASGPLALLGFASVMVLPLAGASGPVGVLALFDPEAPFSERQASLVKVIAAQAAEVITLAALRQKSAGTEGSSNAFVELQDLLGAG